MSRRCCASLPKLMPSAASTWCALAGGWTFRTAPDLAPRAAQRARGRAQIVARRGRDAGDHRLSPAGHPRRDRGDPRRRAGARHARPADGGGLGAAQGPARDARAGRSTGRRPRLFSRISASTASTSCPASTNCAPPACSIIGPAVLGEAAEPPSRGVRSGGRSSSRECGAQPRRARLAVCRCRRPF